MHGGGPRGAAFKAEGGGLCGGGVPRVGWGRVCCLPSCLRRRLRGAAAVVPGQHGRVPRRGGHRLHQLLDQRLGSLRPRPPIPPRPGVSARPPGPPPCRAHPDGAHPPRRDFHAVDPQDPVGIHQLMLDTAEQELGIQPVLSSTEMASMAEPDRLGLITYLSQFYEAFKPSPGEGFRGGLSHPEPPPPGPAGCCPLSGCVPSTSPLRSVGGGEQEAAVPPRHEGRHPLPQQAAEEPHPDPQTCPGEHPNATQPLVAPHGCAPPALSPPFVSAGERPEGPRGQKDPQGRRGGSAPCTTRDAPGGCNPWGGNGC